MQVYGKWLILGGLVLIVSGLILYLAGNKLSWLGHLPGDIRIEKENFSFYFPLTTMIILSVLFNLLYRVIRHFL